MGIFAQILSWFCFDMRAIDNLFLSPHTTPIRVLVNKAHAHMNEDQIIKSMQQASEAVDVSDHTWSDAGGSSLPPETAARVSMERHEQFLMEQDLAEQEFARSGLAGALAKAKGYFASIPRNKTVLVRTKAGGTYTFKYATLDGILAAITPALSQHGLSLIQDIQKADDGGQQVVTTILHESGQLVTLAPVPIVVQEDATAQEWGSALTYAQRYSLRIALVLGPDEDDDGGLGTGLETHTVREQAPPGQGPSVVMPKEMLACKTLAALQDYWMGLTEEQRIELTPAKDLRKAQLAKGTN